MAATPVPVSGPRGPLFVLELSPSKDAVTKFPQLQEVEPGPPYVVKVLDPSGEHVGRLLADHYRQRGLDLGRPVVFFDSEGVALALEDMASNPLVFSPLDGAQPGSSKLRFGLGWCPASVGPVVASEAMPAPSGTGRTRQGSGEGGADRATARHWAAGGTSSPPVGPPRRACCFLRSVSVLALV